MDNFFFSFMNVVIFGFVSVYLVGEENFLAAYFLLMGMIMWQVVQVSQYSISVGVLWNIWSRNLSNMFITPLSVLEYITSLIISGVIKSIIVFFGLSFLSIYFFKFNIFQIEWTVLFMSIVNVFIFSWWVGIFIVALVFRYGTRIQAFSWSIIFVFQPLSANLFPVSVLPEPLQKIAYSIPVTYVFEGMRASLQGNPANYSYQAIALFLNLVYFGLVILFFRFMFKKSLDTGQFARNEG